MSVSVYLEDSGISGRLTESKRKEAHGALEKLWSGGLDFTGWVRLPEKITEESLSEIEKCAAEIRADSDFLVVLGVGGSYMGAKAVIDLLGERTSGTKVIFAGYNFSARYVNEVLDRIKDGDVSLCVISKSGSTTETLSAFGIFRKYMIGRYGREETAKRTYAITERRSNYLYDLAVEDGFTVLDIPLDIGGRYSVLTPVGLLPIAVSGIDIRALVKGAADTADPDHFSGSGLDYAITRQLMYGFGKRIEVFEFFDPYAAFFGEWLKQLFGESEGKEGKGLFPASLMFSRDLHSMGQFLQQGSSSFFETFILAENTLQDVLIPEEAGGAFAGKTIQQINRCAEDGVYAAHVKAGVPAVKITVDSFSPESTGELIYFFETQCAVSALLSGVNPFDQPGVEAYKAEMKANIRSL
ncbi:MAG: glucose-6-phosphate isomerase [Anaerovoracaceae bacterium]|jgi:glucose-6-phosphate isomerase